jgi:fatty-acyl-CoA synthase
VDADISSVRVAYTGGSPLPTELAGRFEESPGIPVRNILGMTESSGLVTIEPFAAPRVAGSTGLRLPYTDVRVREDGMIVLRGPNVSPSYTDAARNAGMFEGGWLLSGDLGHIDEAGYLHVTGRAKDVIIRGSHNIDPGLVEDAFLAHAAVAMCAVVGEPDAHAGEVPAAFVTLKPGASISGEELLALVAPNVYERPAVPKRVVVLDALPLTAIGKVYKPSLRMRAIELKLREVLAGTADAPSCRVETREHAGRFTAVVHAQCARDEAMEARWRQALGAIALPVEFLWMS